MKFKYEEHITSLSEIDIPDIGNCAIVATTLLSYEYVLVIETRLGYSRIFKCGPIVHDTDKLPNKLQYSYEYYEYSQSKIKTTINKFLHDQGVVKARLCTKSEALSNCYDIIEYMSKTDF